MKQVNLFLCLLVMILYSRNVSAQAANNWYFGRGAGITFNTNPPSSLPLSIYSTLQLCGSVSDSTGKFLFFANGYEVYNAEGKLMKNGNDTLDHLGHSQSAMVVQQPGSNHLYYIFTCDEPTYISAKKYGYRYNIVDMNGDNGKGEVIKKDQLLQYPSSAKMAAFQHANGRDVWVVMYDVQSTSFSSYKLGCAGLETTPVISKPELHLPTDSLKLALDRNMMKASPDGKLLAVLRSGLDNKPEYIRLCGLDNLTGTVGPPILLSAKASGNFSAEFSLDSKLLYVTTGGPILQFDVSVLDSAAINSSLYIINSKSALAMQMGPDKKIYISNNTLPYLSYISQPGIKGAGCDFLEEGISINGPPLGGFPNFFGNQVINAEAVIDATTNDSCASTVQLTATSTLPGNLSWSWNLGDGTVVNTQTVPSHTYKVTAANKVYQAKLTVFSDRSDCNTRLYATSTINLSFFYPELNAGKDTVIIKNIDLQLQASGAVSYSWTPPTGLSDQTIPNPVAQLAKDQTYYLKGTTDNGCVAYDTLHVQVIPEPTVWVPTAFTPNRDGLNETLRAFYIGIKKLHFFRIYNRTGQLVFQTTDQAGKWNGKITGIEQDIATFIWQASATTIQDKEIVKSGTFILLR